MLGVISTQRLPYPSNSFDMAHCSRCLIPWTEFGTYTPKIDCLLFDLLSQGKGVNLAPNLICYDQVSPFSSKNARIDP